jgi:hypothetical protein
MGDMRNSYNILFGKHEGNRPLEKSRCRWEGNLGEIGWEGVDWIHLDQYRDQWCSL